MNLALLLLLNLTVRLIVLPCINTAENLNSKEKTSCTIPWHPCEPARTLGSHSTANLITSHSHNPEVLFLNINFLINHPWSLLKSFSNFLFEIVFEIRVPIWTFRNPVVFPSPISFLLFSQILKAWFLFYLITRLQKLFCCFLKQRTEKNRSFFSLSRP